MRIMCHSEQNEESSGKDPSQAQGDKMEDMQ